MKRLLYKGPAYQVLHEQYAKQNKIDNNAGSQAADSIDINAPAAIVWQVLADMEHWPAFNSIVSDVRLESGVTVDGKGSFKLKGFPISFTFAVVAPNRELTWTGKTLWAKAIDRLWLEPLSDSRTRLHLEESLSGPFMSQMSSSKQLHRQHMTSLRNFKTAAESLAPHAE